MLTLNSIIQRDTDTMVAEVGQDLVMVNIATGFYYGLSDVGREIWNAIERPTKIFDLVNDLSASHEIGASACEEQTLSFLETLREEGLLQVEDGSTG